jgi:hypothetical protein
LAPKISPMRYFTKVVAPMRKYSSLFTTKEALGFYYYLNEFIISFY